ncbi:MAG TPA: DUF167 domain-containing protein [Chitinispirillaceae bacterium]|nr:DUF167 domain-containing protein [Chitinispirillaceae bacterium]
MNSCTIDIRLKPRSKKDKITIKDSVIEIAVTSPPVDNKANMHLVRLLAKRLNVSRSSIQIIKGEHSRNKSVAITGISLDQAIKLLENND